MLMSSENSSPTIVTSLHSQEGGDREIETPRAENTLTQNTWLIIHPYINNDSKIAAECHIPRRGSSGIDSVVIKRDEDQPIQVNISLSTTPYGPQDVATILQMSGIPNPIKTPFTIKPVQSKPVVPQESIVPQRPIIPQESIVLSSDDESGMNPSPGKRRKIRPDDDDTHEDMDMDVQQSSPTVGGGRHIHNNNAKSMPSPASNVKICKKVPHTNNHNNIKGRRDIPPCSIERDELATNAANIDRITPDCENLHQLTEQIDEQCKSETSELGVTLSCTSIRVGSYVQVNDSDHWTVHDYKAKICEKGILFCMAHTVTSGKLMQLVVPHNLIISEQAHFSVRTPSFIVFRVGNKIARFIRDKLGMSIERRRVAWFDPFEGSPSERNIVLVTDMCSDFKTSVLRKIYGHNLQDLDYQTATTFRKEIGLEFDSDIPELDDTLVPVTTTNKTVITKHITKTVTPRPASKVNVNGQNPTLKPATPASVMHKPEPYHSFDGSKPVLKWPEGQGGMTLLQRDIYALKPEQFLNDEIIDFWLSYVLKTLLSKEDRERTHLFSIHFYSRLTQVPKKRNCPAFELDKSLTASQKRHRRVKKWTKNVDIFSKDFIIIPIIDNCHWYVAIIAFPGLQGPHWMNDETSIPDWVNLLKINGRPTYQPPPGMPKKEVTKSRRKKRKPTNMSENSSQNKGNPPTSVTPSSKDMVNGVHNSKVDGKEKVVSTGIPPATPKIPPATPKISPATPKTQTNDVHNNKTPCTLTIGLEERDEADEDPDENSLFEDYFSSDSEAEATKGRPTPGLSETSESSKCRPIPGICEEVNTKDKNEDQDKVDKLNNEEAVTIKTENESVVKEEPMEIDQKEDDEVPTEAPRTDFRVKQPCIILFDSLSGFPRSRVFTTLRDYLKEEHKERKGIERSFSNIDVPGFMPNVPQQKNLCDCGIYVLEYVEHFFSKPFYTFSLPIVNLKKWFPELKNKRKEIYDTIYSLVKAECPEKLHLMPKFEPPVPTTTSTTSTVKTQETTTTKS